MSGRNWRWRRDLPTLAVIVLLILIEVLANSLGATNSGHGILPLVSAARSSNRGASY